jgi:hypothetical protein
MSFELGCHFVLGGQILPSGAKLSLSRSAGLPTRLPAVLACEIGGLLAIHKTLLAKAANLIAQLVPVRRCRECTSPQIDNRGKSCGLRRFCWGAGSECEIADIPALVSRLSIAE